MKTCTDCGVFVEHEGFILVEPSDCHAEGGHYISEYDHHGQLVRSGRPWQAGEPDEELTKEQMEEAK